MMQKDFQYGGQAVIEGVMMRGRHYLAVAVRRGPDDIVIHKEPVGTVTKKYPILKIPVVRGVVAFIETFVLGLRVLLFSANQFVSEEEQGKLTVLETILTVGAALALTVVLFILLPLGLRALLARITFSEILLNLAEGIIRALILVLYIFAVSRLKDIRRIWAYHGAEHKTIHAYEHHLELNIDNVRDFTTLHPRCGTSFLLFVVIIAALLFSLLGHQTFLMRFVSRILLMPVVAGLSYELLKLAGKYQKNFLVRWISAPGMWLQRLTTKPPDEPMIEVAITALREVLAEDARVDEEQTAAAQAAPIAVNG